MANQKMEHLAVSVFCQNMAMMLDAGIQPDEAVGLLCEDTASEAFGTAVKELNKSMIMGNSLSAALKETEILPAYATQMIAVGETSGRTEAVLYSLADYYERQEAIKSRIKSAITYPTILLLLMCVVLGVMVGKVLPVFIGVYTNLAGTLSGSAYAYVSVAYVIAVIALIVTIAACIVLLGGMAASASESGMGKLTKLLEKVPLTKSASRQLAVSHFTEVIATLIASGMNTDEAIEEAVKMVTHTEIKELATQCQKEMVLGKSLAQAFYECRFYEPLYGRMLLSGAHSGKLEGTLAKLAETSSEDAQDQIYRVIDRIEPILTGFLTLAIGITLISVMIPLIGILGTIG